MNLQDQILVIVFILFILAIVITYLSIRWKNDRLEVSKTMIPKGSNIFKRLNDCANNLVDSNSNIEASGKDFNKFGKGLDRTSKAGEHACSSGLNLAESADANMKALKIEKDYQKKASKLIGEMEKLTTTKIFRKK